MGLFTHRVLGLSSSLSLATALLSGAASAQSAQPPAAAPGQAPAAAPAQPPAAAYPPAPGAAPAPAPAPAAAPPAIYYVQPAYAPPPPPPPQAYDSRPRRLPYNDGDTVPAGYVVDTRTRKGLWIPGVIMIGAPWALGLTIASGANFDNSSGWLAVPVLGPWIMLAARDSNECESDPGFACDVDDGSDAVLRTWLVLDGLIQGTGAVMTYVGFTATKTELVRTDYSLTVVPSQVGSSGYGATAVGTF